MKIYIILILFVSLVGCRINKEVKEEQIQTISSQTISIPQDLILKNRISNCDSAKIYMKNIVHPVKAFPAKDLFYPVEKQISIIIPGESDNMWKDDRYLIHLNPECFLNASVDEIIDIFCPINSRKDFMEINKKYQEKRVKWQLSISSLNDFSMGFWIENGIVIRASIGGGVKEQK